MEKRTIKDMSTDGRQLYLVDTEGVLWAISIVDGKIALEEINPIQDNKEQL